MFGVNKIISLASNGFLLLILAILSGMAQGADLNSESMGKIEKLPAKYPATWLYAHDPNFSALTEGKVVVVDVNSENRHYKGTVSSAQFGSFVPSNTRNELYSAETYYSRGTRGKRTDVLSIFSKSDLAFIEEIILPGNKRGLTVTEKNALRLVDNDNYLLLFNFTPAASVSIIDIEQRKILNSIDIPGCSLIYPTGKRGFSSLCADGGMLSFQFDKKGQISEQFVIPSFFDAETDPLFEKSIYVDGIAYFPTFLGQIQPIDLSQSKPKILPSWSLLSPAQLAKNWRPAGWQIGSAHPDGFIYLLMQENGFNGSHKNGGSEVWVFNVSTKQRVSTIKLKSHGISIEVTKDKYPLLVVTNSEMNLDVYNAKTGKHIRMIGAIGVMPIVLHASETREW